MERLQFVGLNELDSENATAVQKLAERHMDKIDKIVQDARLKLVLKLYHTEGKSKVSVDAHFTYRGGTVNINSHGWEVPIVVTEALNKAETVLSKK